MLYRENGQFKSTYRADQQIFPILQDRIALGVLLAAAFVLVPLLASQYLLRAICVPFLILSLAALGLNILVGYCGQISLGTGAFMAIGAYGAYNAYARIDGMPLIAALLLGGVCSTAVGVLFGVPSLRIKGLYLAVATLAAQFFTDWAFLRIRWFTNDSSSGSVNVAGLNVLGVAIESPVQKYLFCLVFVVLFGLLAKNLVRGAIGREWMAIRDMDVAAAVIGIRPVTSSGPSSMTATWTASSGSMSGASSVSRNVRAPEGQCSMAAIIAVRATTSLAPAVSLMISRGRRLVCCSNRPSRMNSESRSVPGITMPWKPVNWSEVKL